MGRKACDVSDAKLTSNTGETQIGRLLEGHNILTIPFFQRPYKWKPKRLEQLETDILSLVDDDSAIHFLGAIITFGRPSAPADPSVYEIIDGQQRLTTLYLYMCAIIKTLLENGAPQEANTLFQKYLTVGVGKHSGSNLKLQPSNEDRGDLNAVIQDLLDTKEFSELSNVPATHLLPNAHSHGGRILANYRRAKTFCRRQLNDEGVDRIRKIYVSILNQMAVVQIDVKDPISGPKIFDSLNSRQEPMTIGDLVRNEIFARKTATDPEDAILVEQQHWQPFYRQFKHEGRDYFDDYFFPYGLIHDPNVKKTEVYTVLKKHWAGLEPAEVIADLKVYQNAYMDLRIGSNRSGLSKTVATTFRRFHDMGAPTSIYPFLMQLARANKSEIIGDAQTISLMEVLDSFLIRRALCGHEPTGLHAVFKKLWHDIRDNPTPESMSSRIRSHRTVAWPDNDEVSRAVMSRDLYGTSVARYVLYQHDRSLGGDDVSALPTWIEHVMPQNRSEPWKSFTIAEHEKYKNVFANLLPLSSQMNNQLKDSSYSVKSKTYLSDSMYKSAREFAAQYTDWTPEELVDRGETLASWAIVRWPHDGLRLENSVVHTQPVLL